MLGDQVENSAGQLSANIVTFQISILEVYYKDHHMCTISNQALLVPITTLVTICLCYFALCLFMFGAMC